MVDADNCGSTACVCIVRQEFGHKVLYIANVGDTRAVISKNGQAERLSIDHRGSDHMEQERIRQCGGFIVDNRVGGSLAVTRAFGDHCLKSQGVIPKPYINKHVLRPFDKFLIVATDGVWDTLEDQDVVNLCNDNFSAQQICQSVVRESINKGSKDNTTAIVIKF